MYETPTESKVHEIAYEKVGSGPPILLIHGLTYDRRMWRPLVGHLAAEHTCIAIDLPGHGKSGDARSYDLLAVVRKLFDAFRTVDNRPPIVVGHSMGALFAVAYAAVYPVAGLVTSDQTLRVLPFLERVAGMGDALHGSAFLAIWRAIESELGIDLIPEPQRALVESASNPRQEIVLGYWREAFDTPAAVLQAILFKFAANIDAPFTAIFGDEVASDYRAWLGPIAPHCKFVALPNSGHFPQLVEIDRFAAEVRALAQKTALVNA
jgi:pimeloyl-ACP methyl ester carboxylesterase